MGIENHNDIMANKNLFEQAIIDAKAIREAAIANAKLALEENLTEGVKEMLAEKLKALEEEVIDEADHMEEEETMEEMKKDDSMEETVAEGEEESMEEEVVAEAEEDEELDAEEEPAEEEDMEDDSEEVEDEVEDSEEVESEVEDMSIEDLKDLIRDILAQEMGEEGEDEADMEVDLEEPVDGIEEPADMEGGDEEEVDLEELLSELAEGEDKMEEEVDEATGQDPQGNQRAPMGEGDYEMEEGEEVMEESVIMDLAQQLADQGLVDPSNALTAAKAIAAGVPALATAIGGGVAALRDKMASKKANEEAELEEALATINTLQEELNETNLLNAKLLYLNKIFKTNNLTEAQKANTIASFDKAETVKEVKLVFETVSENLTVASTKKPVNEVKGMASKAAGVAPKKPEIISEGNEVVNRLQFLAGIIKK